MSGIIPLSVVNYDWTVKINNPSFLNVSFPFMVKIHSIWFTTQQMYGDTSGLWQGDGETVDLLTTERTLVLAASKTKNSKTQHDNTDNPSDYMYGFENLGYNDTPSDLLKPTMWLGNPDDAEGRTGAFSTSSGFFGNELSLRSTAKTPIEKARVQNTSWSEEEFDAQTYLANVAIMNTDEFLQLWVYNSEGDWTGYEDDAKVTISVAYTGIHDIEVDSAKPWEPWFADD
jgi:hypothetical protein